MVRGPEFSRTSHLLLDDLARNASSREELHDLLDRQREFTERSGATIRNWTKKLKEIEAEYRNTDPFPTCRPVGTICS